MLVERMATVNDAINGENELVVTIGGNDRGNGGGGDGEGGSGGGGGGVGGGNMEEVSLKKGPWTASEDAVLIDYVTKHGEGNWNAVQRNAGLNRCGKSCRLRWANHLRPNLKKGAFSSEEEKLIVELHAQFGNKWARMAALLPGRTDNEIKNYWNTRIKRRQRQGLPLYSDDHDHHHHRPTTPTTPTTSSPCVTPTGSNPNTVTKFEFFNQNLLQHHHQQHPLSPTASNHHSPLTSPLQHRPSSSPYHSHTFLEPEPLPLSSSAPSPLSFTFQRPAPVLCSPFRFKRYRSSPRLNLQVPCSSTLPDPPMSTHLSDLQGFRFPVQLNSSFSQFFQPSLLDSDLGVSSSSSSSAFPTKLEFLSNHFSKPPQQEQDNKLDIDFNVPAFQSNSAMLGDLLLEAQALASGQNSKKRSNLSLNEGNDVFDGCQGFEDLPLNSFYWSSSTPGPNKPEEEAPDPSKFTNEDLSSLLSVIPSSNMQDQHWEDMNALEPSNVQYSGSVMIDDNFGLDIKPIASLFPLSNTSNNNENPNYHSWENFPSFS